MSKSRVQEPHAVQRMEVRLVCTSFDITEKVIFVCTQASNVGRMTAALAIATEASRLANQRLNEANTCRLPRSSYYF